jgi:hypothetical protein
MRIRAKASALCRGFGISCLRGVIGLLSGSLSKRAKMGKFHGSSTLSRPLQLQCDFAGFREFALRLLHGEYSGFQNLEVAKIA